jgi:hypothetical protein
MPSFIPSDGINDTMPFSSRQEVRTRLLVPWSCTHTFCPLLERDPKLYSAIAEVHDLRHATNTGATYFGGLATYFDVDKGVRHPLKGLWASIGSGWSADSGYIYGQPVQHILEQRWGAVGVDPRMVNDIGPYFHRGTTAEPLRDVEDTQGHSTKTGATEVDTEHRVTYEPTLNAAPDVRASSLPRSGSLPGFHGQIDGSITDNICMPHSPIAPLHRPSSMSREPRVIASLPRRSLGKSPAVVPASDHVQPSAAPQTDHCSTPLSSRCSSPDTSPSDDDYIETSSGAVKRAASANDGPRKCRSTGRTTTPAISNPHAGSSRRRFPCPREGCSQVCDRLHDLERHLESKAHKEPSYKCEWCSHPFTRIDSFRRHMQSRCPVLHQEETARKHKNNQKANARAKGKKRITNQSTC